MFFAPDMLSKRGPLAKVWLAAHVEKKVSKTQTLQTSIPSTVTVILDPGSTASQPDGTAPPLALRLSGQLLLGITRIYGKQAKYLLEDCSEASDKIRAAFRAALATDLGGPNQLGIKMAPENGPGDAQNAINLRPANRNIFDFELEFGGEFDGFGDAWEADQFLDPEHTRAGARITANLADITLPDHDAPMNDGAEFEDLGDRMDLDFDLGFGGPAGRHEFDEADGLALDFELDSNNPDAARRRRAGKRRAIDDEEDEDGLGDKTLESQHGRDAPGSVDRRSARESLGLEQTDVHLSDKSDGHPGSVAGGEISMDVDPGFEQFDRGGEDFAGQNFDLGLDLGIGGDGGAPGDRTPQASRSREQTPTPHPQAASQNPLLGSIEVTPRTSHRLAQLQSPVRPADAQADGVASAVKKPPTKRARTQAFDMVTELEGNGVAGRTGGLGSQGGSQSLGIGAASRAEKIAAGLYVEPNYLPKNRYELACLEIRLNPRRNKCLPKTMDEGGSQWLLAAPPGICAELTNLFRFPAPIDKQLPRMSEEAAVDQVDIQQIDKRVSLGSEMGRRPMEGLAGDTSGADEALVNDTFDRTGDETGIMAEMDENGPILEEEFRFDMRSEPDRPDEVQEEDGAPQVRSPSRAPTEVLPARPRRAEGESSILDLFDELSEPQATQSSVRENATQDGGRTKWSKNTVKALKVLNAQLSPDEDNEEPSAGRKKLGFETVADKASKRAASSFFFELLVLATRDCLKLEQTEAYGPIVVQDQDRLWEVMEQEAI